MKSVFDPSFKYTPASKPTCGKLLREFGESSRRRILRAACAGPWGSASH